MLANEIVPGGIIAPTRQSVGRNYNPVLRVYQGDGRHVSKETPSRENRPRVAAEHLNTHHRTPCWFFVQRTLRTLPRILSQMEFTIPFSCIWRYDPELMKDRKSVV